MQRERLLQVEKWRNQPDDHEAERHRQLNNGKDPRKCLRRRRIAVAVAEPCQQHGAHDGHHQHDPVRNAVRAKCRPAAAISTHQR